MNLNPEDLVIYVDQALLVVSKPAGLPALPDGYDPEAPYLVGTLKTAFDPLWTVHRLDRYTSGVMVFARTAEAHRALSAQFEERRVSKIYHALVSGDPPWGEKTVTLPLRPDGDRKHRTVVDPRRGKPSATDLSILERFGCYTLIEAAPHTGRTHQIRVHLAVQGHPLVADTLYGNSRGFFLSEVKPGYHGDRSEERPVLGRLGLHARYLTLIHPNSGEERRFEAPYPKDFEAALKQLRKYNQKPFCC